jgi:SAM-dependent methyltransferase
MANTNASASPGSPDASATRATLVSLAKELLAMSEMFEPKQQEQIFAIEPEIVLKAKAFIAAVQSPVDYSMATVSAVMGAAVVRTLSHLKAFQAIPYPEGATAETVAEATGSQTSLIERLLRSAASIGFLSYDVPSRVFKHTHLSAPWAQPNSAAEDVFTMCYDTGLAPMILLPEWLGHNNPQQASEPSGENSGTHNPLTYYNHIEGKTAFETLARHPENLAVFGRVLKAAASFRPFTGIYPWERLADADAERPLFVDIGGGTGHAIAAILAAHPELPASGFVLQELPEVIASARESGILPEGVQYQTHDFLTPNPVKGAKAYHLRACLHDWPDVTCVRMLKCVASAMAPDSRLLIAEALLPEDPRGDMGGLMGVQDMLMLCIGGKERTVEGFERVVREAGLVAEKVWEGDGTGRFVVLECRLAGC